jgi:protocatechuate 3,4-dioxygenase beta subunit
VDTRPEGICDADHHALVHDGDELPDHDRGLAHDLPMLLSRRRLLTLLGGGAGALALTACGPSSLPTSVASSTGTSAAGGPTSGGTQIPEETAGPYPGDGSNGVNVLRESGIVRRDLTRSFGTAAGIAGGVPLTIRLTVLDTRNGSATLAGAAIYLWHCDIDGRYSLYSPGVTNENYLRGVQESDATGAVTFTSIFPGAYAGRWPHIHFEVYPSLAAATAASAKLRTTQLALPEEACHLVYATAGYEQSVRNLAQTSLARDNVFGDGYSLQLATVTGSVEEGMTATLPVPV